MKLTPTQIKLISYIADGAFHSGQQLADNLSISRTSIWNYLSVLERDLGFVFHAVRGKGTRLVKPLELLDKERIQAMLPKGSKGLLGDFSVLSVTESTNHCLVAPSAALQPPSGSVCTAEMQTLGRGRLGRTWVSPFAQNIYISFLWRFNVGLSSLSGLSLACGVAVCEALEAVGLKGHGLKWPNDILWEGKKLGGILVEIQGENQGEYKAVIGLGLNYQMSPQAAESIDQPWVSMENILGTELPGRNRLVAELINHMLPLLKGYGASGLVPFVSRWNAYDCYRDQQVQIISAQAKKTGLEKGISESGELLLLTAEGEIEKISSGEVSLRLEQQ